LSNPAVGEVLDGGNKASATTCDAEQMPGPAPADRIVGQALRCERASVLRMPVDRPTRNRLIRRGQCRVFRQLRPPSGESARASREPVHDGRVLCRYARHHVFLRREESRKDSLGRTVRRMKWIHLCVPKKTIDVNAIETCRPSGSLPTRWSRRFEQMS